MKYEEIDYYRDAAMNVMYEIPRGNSASGWNQFLELDKALGITEYRDFYVSRQEDDTPLAEELKKLLLMLAGPHGKTILKAYRIRKGLK